MTCGARLLLLCLAIGAPARASAATKSIHWRVLHVEALLGANGDLHVVERHTMVFTGDWNGGERVFRVEPHQRLQLLGVRRIDGDGAPRALSPGSLDQVDRYAWVGGGENRRTLRWRSRAGSDPPFLSTEITYVLEYTISGVLLRPADETYRFKHDFAFADRPGPIAELSATLWLDPAWGPSRGPLTLSRQDLQPGAGAVMTVDVRRGVGALATRGEDRPIPPVVFPAAWHVPLVIAMVSSLLLAAWWVFGHGRARAQFVGRTDAFTVDEPWLRTHVLVHPPELVGALWDDKVGAPEVSAVLARMAVEGKIETMEVRKPFGVSRGLGLRLRVDRARLDPTERRLVEALFFDGDVTDTWRLRDRYRAEGLDPAGPIAMVGYRARSLLRGPPLPRWPWFSVAGLVALAIVFAGLNTAAGQGVDVIGLAIILGTVSFW